MKDKLGKKIMANFVQLRGKTYSHLIHHCSEDKKAKSTLKSVIQRKLKFANFERWFEATQHQNKVNHLVKNEINLDSLKKT